MKKTIEKMSIDVLEAKQSLLSEDVSDRCEDCPDINLEPPAQSDCPHFEMQPGGPICNREDSMRKELERFLGKAGFDDSV